MMKRFVAAAITTTTRVLTGAQCRWAGCAPDPIQRIYYANHTSHVDFVLLWSALPPHLRSITRPVAAADYWSAGPIRRYIIHDVFSGVLLDRSGSLSANPIAPLIAAVDGGHSLILFPEGTRGDGESLQPFRSGIYHLARERPSIEMVPVWMHNAYRVMPKGAFLPVPLLCSATFGSPVRIGPDEEKAMLLDRLRQRLLELAGA
ncbi:MAG: lysophospholipid acyltransferase family protein [Longimicrobiales bacterium]